ncbi:Fe2+-dependent dioxygenase [Lacisediminimonas profundi]|uniref:Fe2+-dependent dioxygenase n=1 Tax=Lacisediminimonas profundi TaxID=2603856 RepID=UPI00124B3794|nr:Fe2+-dependent dioxygenase [Lacisediminimonas profundi]
MILHLQNVLSKDEVRRARALLDSAPWSDGRPTAGEQAAQVKNNLQLPEACEQAQAVRELVLYALKRHELFFSAALPKKISPPLFNSYGGQANTFGKHVDTAVRFVGSGNLVRTDLSCTLFLSEPDQYDGGELEIMDSPSGHRVKLPAGDMVLYPANTLHGVEPVTRGRRTSSFFWIESMVRSEEQRALLFNMDQNLIRLRSLMGETDPATVGLTSTYHNLLRMWADT